jgi:cell division protein FtsB
MPPLNTPDHVAWYQQRIKELEAEIKDLRSQSPTARFTEELGARVEQLERENRELKMQAQRPARVVRDRPTQLESASYESGTEIKDIGN